MTMSKSSSTSAARPTLPPESSRRAARRQVDSDIAELIARSRHNRRETRALLAEYGKNVSQRTQIVLLFRADCATVRRRSMTVAAQRVRAG